MKASLTQETLERGFYQLFGKQGDAAEEYRQIRNKLVFFFRDLSEPEELADEVLERMIRKAGQEGVEISGDVRHYARSLAWYVKKEYLKKTPVITPYDLSQLHLHEEVDTSEREFLLQILEECLEELQPNDRVLILNYYENDRKLKIEMRKKLAAELGMSIPSLRVRAHRIRFALANMIKRKLRAIEKSRIS